MVTEKKFYAHLENFIEGNDFSKCTKRAYRMGITSFLKHTKPWKKGWQQRAMQWRGTLKLAPASQHLYIVAARRYLGECQDKKMVTENPLDKIKVKVEAYGVPRRMLSDEEVGKLLVTANGNLRDRAILILMLHTGMRIGGAAEIKIGDFDIRKDSAILKYQCKGHRGKDATAVLAPIVMDAINEYMSETDRSFSKSKGYLFLSKHGKRITIHAFRKMIIRRMEVAGIRSEGVCVHSLRHTAATKADEAGKPILAIRDMLGHKSVQTTELYIHSIRRIKDAAELGISYGIKRKRKKKKKKKRKKKNG